MWGKSGIGVCLGSSSGASVLDWRKVRFSGLDTATTIIQVHKFEDIKWNTWSLIQMGSYTNNMYKKRGTGLDAVKCSVHLLTAHNTWHIALAFSITLSPFSLKGSLKQSKQWGGNAAIPECNIWSLSCRVFSQRGLETISLEKGSEYFDGASGLAPQSKRIIWIYFKQI